MHPARSAAELPQHSIAARNGAAKTKAGEIPAALSRFDQLPDAAFVGSDVVRGLMGDITDVSLWRWVKTGKFPAPKKMPGGRINSWRVGDLRAWLAQGVQ